MARPQRSSWHPRSRQHRHAARSLQQSRGRRFISRRGRTDGSIHPQCQRQLLPTRCRQTPCLSYHHHLLLLQRSCLAPARRGDVPGRWGTAGLGAPGNSLPARVAPVTCCCSRRQLLFSSSALSGLQTPACAQGNGSGESPVPLRAAPSCVSGDSRQRRSIHARAGIHRSAALIHGEVKHLLVLAAGTCHHPIFPNYPKMFSCRTKPLVAEEKAAAWQAMNIPAALQSFVRPGEAPVAEGPPNPAGPCLPHGGRPAACPVHGATGLKGTRPHPGILSSRHLRAMHRGYSSCAGSGSRDRPRQRRVPGAPR